MRHRFAAAAAAAFFVFHPTIAPAQQAPTGPRVLVLVPSVEPADARARAEIRRAEASIIAATRERVAAERRAEIPDEFRSYVDNRVALLDRMSIGTSVAMATQELLVYYLIERLPGLRVHVDVRGRRAHADSLRAIAREDSADVVVGLRSLRIGSGVDGWEGRLEGELYHRVSDSIVAVLRADGDDANAGGEYTCEAGTLGCVISNALSHVMEPMARAIILRDPTLVDARRVRALQVEALRAAWRAWSGASAVRALLPADTALHAASALYFGDVSADGARFVAAFVDREETSSIGRDGEVTVIMSEGDPYRAVGYIVSGMRYEGEWHYRRDRVTIYGARDSVAARDAFLAEVARTNWFRDGTTQRNPEYWTSGPFEVLVDPATKSGFDSTSQYDIDRRMAHFGYYGLPLIVAESRAERDERRRDSVGRSIVESLVPELFARQRAAGLAPYTSCDSATWIRPLSDSAATRVIVPMTVGCGSDAPTLLYWAFVRESDGTWSSYEWTLPGRRSAPATVAPAVSAELSKHTVWSFLHPWLGDERFWRERVLVRDAAGEYRHLRPLAR